MIDALAPYLIDEAGKLLHQVEGKGPPGERRGLVLGLQAGGVADILQGGRVLVETDGHLHLLLQRELLQGFKEAAFPRIDLHGQDPVPA